MTMCLRARLLASALLPLAAPAWAEHSSEILVTGQLPAAIELASADVAATPGGAALVLARDYADRFATSFADMLRNVPGVYAQGRYGEEVRLSIRGSGIGRGPHLRGVALLIDGVPVNLADGSGDFQEIDPTMIAHLDVRRGANALRYGATGLGGAINAVTPTARTLGHRFEGRVEGGSFGAWRAHATGAVAGERADFLVGMTGSGAEGYRAQSEQFKVRINANLGYRLTGAIETRFYVMLNHLDQQVPGGLTYDGALRKPRTAPAANIANDYARDIRSVRLLNRTSVALQGTGRIEFGGYFNAKSLYHPIFQVIDQQSHDSGGFARISGGSTPFEWLAGVEAQFGTVDARRYVNLRGKRGAETVRTTPRAHTISGYAEARYYPVPNLALIGGVVAVDGMRALRDERDPSRSDRVRYSAVSPKLGLLWTLRPGAQVYANVSRAVELPTLSELVQGTGAFVPLKPQRGWTAEIGTRGTAGPVAWDVSLYRANLRGELLGYTIDPAAPPFTLNAGRTVHQGIEGSLSVALNPVLTATAAYTLSDFRFRDDAAYGGNRLPVVPVHRMTAELAWRSGPLTLRPSIDWIPQGAWADYANSTRARGHAVLGFGGSLRVMNHATLFAEGRNLTGRRGITDISATPTAGPQSAIYHPLEGGSVYAGLRLGL